MWANSHSLQKRKNNANCTVFLLTISSYPISVSCRSSMRFATNAHTNTSAITKWLFYIIISSSMQFAFVWYSSRYFRLNHTSAFAIRECVWCSYCYRLYALVSYRMCERLVLKGLQYGKEFYVERKRVYSNANKYSSICVDIFIVGYEMLQKKKN